MTFWPDDLTENLPIPPTTILKEAASELSTKTNGILVASVRFDEVNSDEKLFYYDFSVTAKSLNYRYDIFYICCKPSKSYPLELTKGEKKYSASSQDELRDLVVKMLNSEDVIMSIKTLIAQAKIL